MHANFARALADVLMHEGGYVNHPKDPGGPTNKGVTLATYRAHVNPNGTVEDIKRITVEEAGKVYREVYWNAIRADELPGGIDHATFDYAVNSGPARAAKALQAVLGVPQDGVIGPVTLEAATAADAATVVRRLCDRRLAFLRGLPTWATFGRGWASRVSSVREDALQLTVAPAPVPAPAPEPHPIEEHEEEIAPPPVARPAKPRRGINWWIVAGIVIAVALVIVAFVPISI